ncbi:2-amino-4-hydroxy-6-hydroxymethyldihydropteridine diphosphokinase [Paracoccus cavernae]|uniref:2-amino-4-hydroxy-6- hydroxymethyldihydropteridine diphosphokinase n=1 Tax=Paracoccus cavernae TaxID=1571207 RepID=UPI0035F4BA07
MQNTIESLGLLALGANLPTSAGNPRDSLKEAIRRINGAGISFRAISRFWETPAFPAGSGPDYVNAAATIVTDLPAEAVLARLHEVEASLGRVRDGGRWGARGIDLDLLALGGQVFPDEQGQTAWRDLPLEEQMRRAPEELILPHPRLQDRGFVLAPLAEVAPLWRHPIIGATVAEMLTALPSASFEGMRPLAA